MALNASPVSRNLHLKVTFLNLELEDLLAIMFAVASTCLMRVRRLQDAGVITGFHAA